MNIQDYSTPSKSTSKSQSKSQSKGSEGSIRKSMIATVAGVALGALIIYLLGMQEEQSASSDPAGMNVASSNPLTSTATTNLKSCADGGLCEADVKMARTAWTYFENNYNPETGLVNAVNNYPSTTMWDTGSALAATITAHDFGFIDKKEFDDRVMAMLGSLSRMELFNDEAPNKVYNTKTLAMVDYANKPSEKGIGVSALDLARLMSWAQTLSGMHPKYKSAVESTLSRWNFDRIIQNEKMYGLALSKNNPGEIRVLQEGRLGYEQYAGKIFEKYGFDASEAASYKNKYRGNVEIMGVNIAHDTRDPRDFHANNYVLTESYTMDAMESGIDDDNKSLVRNIFDVQKKRWQKTGIVTAISEDNINQEPWFLYNTIYNAGEFWQTTNSSDVPYDELKTISTKAAISMALLYPEDEYSAVLMTAVESAYDEDKGWYSGIYENGAGYNDVTTSNTNGVIMSGLLYKKYGPLLPRFETDKHDVQLKSDLLIHSSLSD